MTIVALCSYLSSVCGCFYTCRLECCWIFVWTRVLVCVVKIKKGWKPCHYFLRVNSIPILRKHAPKGNTDGETSHNSKLQPCTCTTMISMCMQCLNRLCAVVVTGSSMLLCWAPCCLSHRRKGAFTPLQPEWRSSVNYPPHSPLLTPQLAAMCLNM